MVIEYIVIDRGLNEYIPVVKANGHEIYRGGIHGDAQSAFFAAYGCDQVERVINGEDPKAVAE